MKKLNLLLLSGFAALLLALAPPTQARAQVRVGIGIGAAPVCPYGYYGYAPYNCAPYGYYGGDWFNGGVFIGAGPWYHGRPGWYGPVNHDFDPRYGYHGPFPGHGGYHEPPAHFNDFHGNDWHGPYGEGHHEGFHGGYHGR